MAKVVLGYLADGFAGPENINQRSLKTIRKVEELYRKKISLGHDTEIWIPKSVVLHPDGCRPLYKLMRQAAIANGIPEEQVHVTELPAYNALSDGKTFADYAARRPMDRYIFVVPNFYLYFLLTYKAMRKYMGDGKKWENISVVSVCEKPTLKSSLLYLALTLITAVASQNKQLWKLWFHIRAREKTKREAGFVSTMS